MNNLGSDLLESPVASPVVFRWERQLNSKQYQFLIVGSEQVHVSALLSSRLGKKLEEAVNGGDEELAKQLKKGTSGKAVSMQRNEITSVAWIEGHKRIEIEAAGKKTVLVFDDHYAMQPVSEGLVFALDEGVRSTEEVSSADQLKLAAPAVLVAIFLAVAAVALDLGASKDYVPTGSRRGIKQLLNDIFLAAPAVVVWALAAAAVVGSIVFVVSRVRSSAERIRFGYDTGSLAS